MLKPVRVKNIIYLVEWSPRQVLTFLQNNPLQIEKMHAEDRASHKKLCRELFLLAARASTSSDIYEQQCATLLGKYARDFQQFKTLHHHEPGSNTMPEHPDTHMAETKNITLDQLQARLFYFMSQYSLHPCCHIAKHIVTELTRLCQHPHIELIPAQQQVYCRSLNLWRSRLLPDNQSGRSRKVH